MKHPVPARRTLAASQIGNILPGGQARALQKRFALMADPAEVPDFGSLEDDIHLPSVVLCLQTPGTDGTDMIVHREDREDYVFLFEALDDASDYALAAQNALGYAPQIGRVRVDGLRFRMARYKPAFGEQVDIPLRGR